MWATDLKLSLRVQLFLVFGLLMAGGLGMLVLDEHSQRRTQEAQMALKDSSLDGLRRMMAISDAYAVDVVDAVWKLLHQRMSWEQAANAVADARVRVALHWQALERQSRSPEQALLFEQASSARRDADQLLQRFAELIERRDRDALQALATVEMYPAIDPVSVRLRYLSDLEMIDAERIVRDDVDRLQWVRAARIALLLLVLGLAALMGRDILRNIYQGVESLVRMAVAMRAHNYDVAPSYFPTGELGDLTQAFLAMRSDLRTNEADLRASLEANEQVRRSLQERELFQRSLLAAAQTAILSVDALGRYTHVNPFAETLLGYRADELVGRCTPETLHQSAELVAVAGELTAALDRKVAQDWRLFLTIAAQHQAAREWHLRRRDGSQVPVLQAVSAMHDDQGQLLGLLFVATDLTEMKRLEDELRASEARAREASLAKSAFVAAMSHEIRTPMIGVTGMVEVLNHTPLNEEQRRSLNVIQHSAENLLQIIGDILDFSKIEAGKLELAATAVSLRKLVASASYNFLGTASSKGLQLGFEVADTVQRAHQADPVRIRQILSNFLSNAVKFTEQGRIDVRLESLGLDGGREQLEFSVRDTGIGIDEAAQKRLFQPFTQAETTTTRKYGGTGLGLTICRRLAELMGGQVTMESQPGRGTTMRLTVSLPLARVEDIEGGESLSDVAPPQFQPRALPTVAEAEAERSLLLLVDDHPTNRLVIARQLALAGYVCETAEDGVEGLRQWESGRYALVFSDVHMPGMDGYEMTRAIRRREAATAAARTPVIALTAAAMKGEAERCLAAGMDDYLTKPCSIPTLIDRLHKWLPHLAPVAAGAATAAVAAASADAVVPASPQLPQLPQTSQPRPVDPLALREISGGDAATERAILDDFMDTTQRDLQALQRALEAADAGAVGREAHKIKGAAKLVGAFEITEAAHGLELAGKAGQLSQLLALQPDLVTAVERLRWYLAQARPS